MTEPSRATIQKRGLNRKIQGAFCIVVMVLIMVLMVEVAFGVVARYILNISVNWVSEIAEFLLIAVAFLSIGYVQSLRRHLAITGFVVKFGQRTQAGLRLITDLVMLVIMALLTWASWLSALDALEKGIGSESARLPLFLPMFLIPIGVLLMCIQLVTDLVQDIRVLGGHAPAAPAQPAPTPSE